MKIKLYKIKSKWVRIPTYIITSPFAFLFIVILDAIQILLKALDAFFKEVSYQYSASTLKRVLSVKFIKSTFNSAVNGGDK